VKARGFLWCSPQFLRIIRSLSHSKVMRRELVAPASHIFTALQLTVRLLYRKLYNGEKQMANGWGYRPEERKHPETLLGNIKLPGLW
jgi:hypothetical protein